MAKQTFTTGQVLTAAQVNSLQANDFNQTVSVKTANYTLVAADKGTRIEFNTSGSVTCTVNTGLFDAGDTVIIQNRGSGTVTVTAGTATVNTNASLAVAQYGYGTLYFISASASIFFADAGGIPASAFTAKGDILVGTGSGTYDKLGVGANGTNIVADSATATGLKWAAASTGAMTKITSQTVSAVANVTFDGCFTSSYGFYLVTFEGFYCSDPNDDLQLQLRYSSTTETTGYFGSSTETLATTSAVTGYGYRATAQATLTRQAGGSTSANGTYFYTTNVGVSGRPTWFGQSIQNAAGGEAAVTFAGTYDGTSRTFDGFLIKSSGGNNLTGTIRVYGMAV